MAVAVAPQFVVLVGLWCSSWRYFVAELPSGSLQSGGRWDMELETDLWDFKKYECKKNEEFQGFHQSINQQTFNNMVLSNGGSTEV